MMKANIRLNATNIAQNLGVRSFRIEFLRHYLAAITSDIAKFSFQKSNMVDFQNGGHFQVLDLNLNYGS